MPPPVQRTGILRFLAHPVFWLTLIFAGLMMRVAKRNFFIGIRTPWTLSSDRVWNQTHKVGGVLFIACGVMLYRRADRRWALRMYLFSLAYLALLFGAMVADVKL